MQRQTTLLFASLLLALQSPVKAVPLAKVTIHGNKRIENETILSSLPFKMKDEIDEQSADMALRSLYQTGYFQDVKVRKAADTLVIHVVENPIINQIVFEGNSKIKDDQFLKDIPLKPRKILAQTDIQNTQQRLLEMYRRQGRYNATVDPKIIRLDNNRVNLVFEIDEGHVTHIKSVTFKGNTAFSRTELEEQLLTKRYKWWRFFASDDVFDPDRFMADQQALRQFYANNGYPDMKIVSAQSQLAEDKEGFHLNFVLEEGEYYKISAFSVSSTIKGVETQTLEKAVTLLKGQPYSAQEVEESINAITDKLGEQGYAFVQIDPQLQKDPQTGTIHVHFVVNEGPRIYIERIDVKGNDRTRDHVIRREMDIHEGDAYNSSKIKRAETKIKDLGYFKDVSIDSDQGNQADQARLNVKVEEQSTGSVKFNVGDVTTD